MNSSIESSFSPFGYWNPDSSQNQFRLEGSGSSPEQTLVYTSRSLTREAAFLRKKVRGFYEETSVFIWIAPFHQEIFSSLVDHISDPSFFIWLCIANFSPSFLVSHPSLCFSQDQWEERMRMINSDDRIIVDFHASLKGTHYTTKLKEQFNQMIHGVALRLKTIKHFKKIWNYNFRANQKSWLSTQPISELSVKQPDYFVLGGPSADDFLYHTNLKKQVRIWSADTALMPLIRKGIHPDVVFSIDAGFGSYEHFVYIRKSEKRAITFVLDPLSFPKYYNADIRRYTYASSHPLVQKAGSGHPVLVNKTGDVYGLMEALHRFLFPEQNLPKMIGHDQKSIHHTTHLKGSAYHLRMYHQMNRFYSTEKYFYDLSKSYGGVAGNRDGSRSPTQPLC